MQTAMFAMSRFARGIPEGAEIAAKFFAPIVIASAGNLTQPTATASRITTRMEGRRKSKAGYIGKIAAM